MESGRGRRGRGRGGFGGGFRREGGFSDQNGQRSETNNWRSRDETETSSESTELYVDQSLVGRIIGKGGSKIRELQDTSGANIKVNSREVEDGKVRVVISGSQDSCSQAEDLIKEITETFNGLSAGDGWGGGGRSGGRRGRDDGDNSDGGGRKTSCYKCGEEGHFARDCPNSDTYQQGGGGRKTTCYKCGEEGHIARDCSGSQSSSQPRRGFGDNGSSSGGSSVTTENTEEPEKPKINWGIIRAAKEANEAKKFEGLPPLEKNFYFEHPSVANMRPEEAHQIRKENNNIIVDGGDKRVANPVRTFEEAFEHYPEILQQIYNQKFTEPSPIQKQAWPILLQGLDLIGIAQTGTGKTLAFLLPALIHIDNQPVPREQRGGPNVLVLSPTRELAQQIEVEVKKINYRGIRSVVVYGGGSRREQIKVVTKGVEIIVATPGRLNDLIMNGIIDVKSVTYLVLDEADRMLDMGFEPEIRKILLDIRRDRQTVMTSATWPQDVQRLADMYMTNPINIFVGTLDLAACHSVTQLVEMIDDEDKKDRLYDFLRYDLQPTDKVICFVGKKVLADDLSSDLAMEGIQCQCIHGDREQCDREAALSEFKSGEVRILIATDVASRGLDVKDITHVFNYDFPRNIEEYVHRIGRTGRAGNTGTSITLVTRGDWRQAQKLIDIMAEADQEIPENLIEMAERYQAHRERMASEGGGFGGRGGRGGRGRGGGFGGGGRRGGGFGGGRRGDDDGFIGGGFSGGYGGGGRSGGGRRDKEYNIHAGW